MTVELEFDRSFLGKEIPAGPFEVTRDLILGFCRAIGDSNPLYTDEAAAGRAGFAGLVAPPTLCTLLVREFNLPNIHLQFKGRGGGLGGEVVRPLAPIVAGDVLHGVTRLKDVYAKTGRSGSMVFVVWETTFANQREERVAEVGFYFVTYG